MRKFGANKTALHFRRRKKAAAAASEEEKPVIDYDDDDPANSAQIIVRELYLRYERQLQRWRDYRNLFCFLGFVALYLAILYLQRNADVAYKVHSTVSSVTIDTLDGTTMQSTEDVYSWIQNLLETVWVDPVCGDGLCEKPFEYASYSRFGCRADCGKLNDIQNLTTIQVDLYFDFSHPLGSMPSSDLMTQASWNICPVNTSYSTDCYYDPDNTFDRLSGEYHYTIADCPDGDWNTTIRRDTFNKIEGAVRDTYKVYLASFYYKVYTAAIAARQEQQNETNLLMKASQYGRMSLFDYLQGVLLNNYTYNGTTVTNGNTSTDNATMPAGWYTLPLSNGVNRTFNIDQLKTATCVCNQDYTGPAANITDLLGPFNLIRDWYPDSGEVDFDYLFYAGNASANASDHYASYQAKYCGNYTTLKELRPYVCSDNTTNCTASARSYDATTFNSSSIVGYEEVTSTSAPNVTCIAYNNTLWELRSNFTTTMRQLLVDWRLGDQRTTGKIAARNEVQNNLRNFIRQTYPELEFPIWSSATGTNAADNPQGASLAALSLFYVDGPNFSVNPPPAFLNLTRRRVIDPTTSQILLAVRADARIAEIQTQQTDVNKTIVYGPMGNFTVDELMQVFIGAGGTNDSYPKPDDEAMGTFNVSYNLVQWDGNTTAYMYCDLPRRAYTYVGQCVDRDVTCTPNTDNPPYNCTYYLNNTAVPGFLNSSEYRRDCELPCDRYYDCSVICECYGTCSSTQTCECEECTKLRDDAVKDSEFVDIQNVATNAMSGAIFPLTGLARRSLLQTNATDGLTNQLTNVLTSLSGVQSQQGALSQRMSQLQDQVNQANQLAQARANDNRLIDLINAGRADIQAGQAAVQAKLDEIIGKQQQALQAAQDAAKALSAIQDLQQKQIQAQQALEAAVKNQLYAIKVATQQNIITITQALQLWKRARRDRAYTLKFTTLSNIPCNPLPSAGFTFKLDNGYFLNDTTARERNIGLTNRVIGGMLLHQWRTDQTKCSESKFDKIQPLCTGPPTANSYGVDPVFKRGTGLYDPMQDDVNSTIVQGIYNCTQLIDPAKNFTPTYNVTDFVLNKTTNPPPFCAELYNPQSLPYAFHHKPLQGKPLGFPIWFDINLSADNAQTWYNYMKEGLYLDQRTRGLTAELITYNAPLRIFGYFRIKFFFSDGGSIQVTYRLYTIRVEMYVDYSDDVRFAFEIILNICVGLLVCIQIWSMYLKHKEKGRFYYYFGSGWAWVDFFSNSLLVATCIIWWVYVDQYADTYNISLRYEVYQSMTPSSNFLALNSEGAEMDAAWDAFNSLDQTINLLNWYYALNGINILLLIARVLKLMDFQPRLGIVTRSLWLAGPDLIHFAIVAGMVFIGYAMMAHLIFGNAIQEFSSFGDSINTCFEILLGNIDVNQELRDLGGLQSVAGALFFWSYELLVFMVLLNFLLAIIVDAFSEIKEKTHETVGLHTELAQLVRDKWRSIVGVCTNNYISDKKLGQLLKQWAGQQENDSVGKENVETAEKVVKVFNEDFDEATLTSVLNKCKEDIKDLQEPTAEEEDKKPKGRFARCLPGKKTKKLQATEEEIKIAAHYIVNRFGVPATNNEPTEDAVTSDPVERGPDAEESGVREAALEKERDQLAQALERLAEVQRELAQGQRTLMDGQKQLAEQQGRLVQMMDREATPPPPPPPPRDGAEP